MIRKIVATALTLSLCAVPAAAQQIDTLALRAHTSVLAHDSLAGRATGTPGARGAADYIVAQLRALGLRPPAPLQSYRLPVPLLEATLHDSSRLVLQTPRDTAVFEHGAGFVVYAADSSALANFAGDAVLIGRPQNARAALGARDLRDRVLVMLAPLGEESVDLVREWKAGGVGGIVMLTDQQAWYERLAQHLGNRRHLLAGPSADPVTQPALPVLVASPGLTRAIVLASGMQPRALLAADTAAIALPMRFDVNLRTEFRRLEASNLVAVVPGRGPRADEYVAYSAHYDHEGVSTPDSSGDSIYNGFSDNAAGVAMLLELARVLRASPPERSVLFLFFSAEEMGLLGSTHLVAEPPVPLEKIVALINLDAGAPPTPPLEWRLAGNPEARLTALAQEVAAAQGWRTEVGLPSRSSDHWPFLQRGVPAVFPIPGRDWEGVDAAQEDALRARWNRYHQPGDEWSPDFPFSGLLRYAEYALRLGRAAAAASYSR